MRHMLVLSICVSTLFVILDVYPGILIQFALFAFLLLPVWLPISCLIGSIYWVVTSYLRGTPDDQQSPLVCERRFGRMPLRVQWRSINWALLILTINILLLVTNFPMRLGFVVSRLPFQALAESASTRPGAEVLLEKRLGLYFVDRCASDRRGGIYFRVHQGPDGIGPDTLSSGFAYKPNPKGTPFGRARYDYSHLFGNWYWFQASNDY